MLKVEPTINSWNRSTPSARPDGVGAEFSRPRLGGFTLFELLLVLSLLVVLGGLVAPMLSGAFTQSKLNSAADDIQSAWSEARLMAIQGGSPMAFRCLLGGPEFETKPYHFGIEETETQVRPDDERTQPNEEEVERDSNQASGKLADGLMFSEAAAASALDSTDPGTQSSMRDGAGWSVPIIFYPDGQSSDALVRIAHEEGRGVAVTLRGLTGISRKSEIGSSGVAVEEPEK